MKNDVKYRGFSEFLRKRRSDKYRSAREFNQCVKIGVSYPQYSRYEAGEQLPNLPQALEIGTALAIPTLEMTLEWNLAQLGESQSSKSKASSEIASLLDAIRAGETPIPEAKHTAVPLDEVIVFNRSHRDLFLKDPAYRDIFTYINSFHSGGHTEEVTADRVSKALSIPMKKLEPMLEKLSDLGVILKSGKKFTAAKSNFYFPDDQDFFELKQQNLRHNVDRIMEKMTLGELQSRKALRGLLTRELTPSQLGWVLGQIEGLLAKVVELPEDPEARMIYSVCAVVGERFSR
jgi:transcriptional regulator with XRE-family HTH domain